LASTDSIINYPILSSDEGHTQFVIWVRNYPQLQVKLRKTFPFASKANTRIYWLFLAMMKIAPEFCKRHGCCELVAGQSIFDN